MTTKIIFRNDSSGRDYEVVAIDADAGLVTLKGELVEFTQPFNKDLGPIKTFEMFGYRVVKEPVNEL